VGAGLGGEFLANKEMFLFEVRGFYQMKRLKAIENFIKIAPGRKAFSI
jgi:hypothetical protein